MFTYLSASMAWPLRDARLAAIDEALNFDWLGFLALSNSSVVAESDFGMGLQEQCFAAAIALHFYRRDRPKNRLAESFAIIAVTALLKAILNLIVPAVGAYDFYAPHREMFSNFT